MRWITKSTLRLELAVEKTKNASLQHEIERLEEYVTKCENLIDHERQRVDDERERADRVNDSLLQQNGLPASTATVRAEQAAHQSKMEEAFEKQQREFAEIYAETMDDVMSDGSDFVQEVKDLINPAVQ